MTRFLFPLVMLCGFLSSGFAAGEPLWNTLSLQQQEQLKEGKPVVIEEEAEGNPWPRLTIYLLVKNSPAKVAAIFWNSELNSQYLPNCLSVHILSRPRPSSQEAQFTLKMPFFLPDEIYVSHIELKRPSSEIYEISWHVLESVYVKECSGNVRIESRGDKSLLRYKNFMVPKSSFACLLRAQATLRVVESVHALARQVEKETETAPQLIKQQMEDLALALGRSAHPVH